jgi:hypothetical protein
MHTQNRTLCSIGVRAILKDARNADGYQFDRTHKPNDACPYKGCPRRHVIGRSKLLHVTAKATLPETDRVPQNARNALVMPLNQTVYMRVYRARSFVLVKVSKLLLEHVKEVLPVRHLV